MPRIDADRTERVAGERCAGVEIHARCQVAERMDVDKVAALQGIGGERRDRNRHVLHVLLTALGRDHDFRECSLIGRGGRAAGRCLLRLRIKRRSAQDAGDGKRRPTAQPRTVRESAVH
jgi:hypothetical protein